MEDMHSDEEESSPNDCIICCQTKEGSFALVPCGHADLCNNCGQHFLNEEKPCPICRTPICRTPINSIMRYLRKISLYSTILLLDFYFHIFLFMYLLTYFLYYLSYNSFPFKSKIRALVKFLLRTNGWPNSYFVRWSSYLFVGQIPFYSLVKFLFIRWSNSYLEQTVGQIPISCVGQIPTYSLVKFCVPIIIISILLKHKAVCMCVQSNPPTSGPPSSGHLPQPGNIFV